MFNKATLLGNIGANPETRTTQNGTKIASFPLATSEKWTAQDGEKKEKTTWHKIVVIGGLSTFISDHANKGDKMFIEGKISHSKYTDKDGIERYSQEIVVTPLFGAARLISRQDQNKIGDDSPIERYDGEEIPF